MSQTLLADAPASLANAASVLWTPLDIGLGSRIHYFNFIVFVACGAIVFPSPAVVEVEAKAI